MRLIQLSRFMTFFLAFSFIMVLITSIFTIQFDTILDLFNDTDFLMAIWFSLKTAFAATVVAFITGVPAGYYLARKKTTASKVLDSLFDIPVVIPPLIVGVLLLTFFNLPFIKSMYGFIFTTAGAVVAQFFVAFPFTVKSSKNAFELVSPMYERIAMTLGAKPFRSFYDTTFKMALPGIASGVILTWLRCLGEFGATLMVGGGIGGQTENIPVNIYINMSGGDFDKGLAASVVTIFIAFFSVLAVKYIGLFRKR